MVKSKILMCVFLLLFGGCIQQDLTIIIRFDQIEGLTKGGRVIFEQNHIGDVKEVLYSDEGHYDVTVVIKKEFAPAVTEYSEFFINDDPQQDGKKAVEMIRVQEGGKMLEDGARVEGTTKTSVYYDQMRRHFEKGIDRFTKEFEEFAEKLQKEADKLDFKELEQEFDSLLEEMKRSSEAAREKMEKDIIPKLKKELEELRKRLEKFREDENVKSPGNQVEKSERI